MLLDVENRLWAQRAAIITATYEKEAEQRAELFENGTLPEDPPGLLGECAPELLQNVWEGYGWEWGFPATPDTCEVGIGDVPAVLTKSGGCGDRTDGAIDLGMNAFTLDTEKCTVSFRKRNLEQWVPAKPIKLFLVLVTLTCKLSDLFLKLSFFLAKLGNLGSAEFQQVLHGFSPGFPSAPDRFKQYPWNPPDYSHRPHTYFHTNLG